LPLPDWYAMHRPRQVGTLAMLAQLLYRLDKLHVSGYCHNDIKPANMVLLDGGQKKKPEWHIVDFTNMSQIGVPLPFFSVSFCISTGLWLLLLPSCSILKGVPGSVSPSDVGLGGGWTRSKHASARWHMSDS
jgi:serine/threonine protein kinase